MLKYTEPALEERKLCINFPLKLAGLKLVSV